MKNDTLDVNNYKFPDYAINAVNKFIEKGVKTNIHFVVSSETFPLAIRIMNGEDIWEGKIDLTKLNAVVFLLFKPQGCGADKKYLCLNEDQIKIFATSLLTPKCKFKVGCDSCMINKVSQVRKLTKLEALCVDTCEAGRMSCYISPDMKFMPCSFGSKDIYGTQITDDLTIQKIWDHGLPFKTFRNVLLENPMSCPYEL